MTYLFRSQYISGTRKNTIAVPANASIIKSSIPRATYIFKIGPMVYPINPVKAKAAKIPAGRSANLLVKKSKP